MSEKDVKNLGTFQGRIRYDDGSFSRAVHQASDSGEASKGFFNDIALGNEPDFSSEFKFGENPDIGTIEEVIWAYGGDYPFMNNGVAETLRIVSSSTEDTNGGAGAWDLIIFGLDVNGLEITDIVLLAGTTPVFTTKQFFRINRAIVIHSGVSTAIEDANQGNITISASTSGNVLAYVRIHDGQTTQAVYTVPGNKIAYATGLSFNVGQGKECRFTAKVRNCNMANCAFTTKYTLTVFQSTIFGDLKVPLKLPALTDIVITGKVSLAPGIIAAASFGMFVMKDPNYVAP